MPLSVCTADLPRKDMGRIRYIRGWGSGISLKVCEHAVHASRPHFHAELSFALVETGSSTVEVSGRRYCVTGPLAMLIPAGATHDCRPRDPSAWRFRMAYIDPNWLEAASGLRREQLVFAFAPLHAAHLKVLLNLFDGLENNDCDAARQTALFREIAFLAHVGKDSFRPNMPRSASCPRLHSLREELETHFSRCPSLDDLCEQADTTKFHLIRQFKKQYGLPPHQYLLNTRINFAKDLLALGRPLVAAALESGFYDQSHFTRFFRAYTGVTPGRYRTDTASSGADCK